LSLSTTVNPTVLNKGRRLKEKDTKLVLKESLIKDEYQDTDEHPCVTVKGTKTVNETGI